MKWTGQLGCCVLRQSQNSRWDIYILPRDLSKSFLPIKLKTFRQIDLNIILSKYIAKWNNPPNNHP